MKWMDWTAEGDIHKVTGDLDQEDEGQQETLMLMLRWKYVTGCLKITVHVFYPGTSYLYLMSNAWYMVLRVFYFDGGGHYQ